MAGHPGLRPGQPPFSLTERRLTYRHLSNRKKLRIPELKFSYGVAFKSSSTGGHTALRSPSPTEGPCDNAAGAVLNFPVFVDKKLSDLGNWPL